MLSSPFKLDNSLCQSPEEIIGMLDFIHQDPDFIVEPFLQGKAHTHWQPDFVILWFWAVNTWFLPDYDKITLG